MSNSVNQELWHQVCQFYYREARLLDERQYQQWLTLVTEDIDYQVPLRTVPMLDNQLRDTEAALNTAQEFNDELEPGHRQDNYLTLMIRATRSFKQNAWADNPPARTLRVVSNIEVYDDGDGLLCYSNTHMAYQRHSKEQINYAYQRIDTLKSEADSFKIQQRQVRFIFDVVQAPSLGLLF